jgi:2-oxoacid:acceptor oxidoreductase gamma subunit (pyruvate/2-ketoisovalerate family)
LLAIRFHGRGGQGAVIASKLLAAAMFREGWQVQAFPSFGAERTGAPVAAFLRAAHERITIHSHIYEPDHVVVLDPVLLTALDVTAGLRAGGSILVNSARPAPELSLPSTYVVSVCDATAIALRHGLGTRTSPIVNTAMAGAFAAVTHLVALDTLLAVIPDVVPQHSDANQAAAREAFEALAAVAAVR